MSTSLRVKKPPSSHIENTHNGADVHLHIRKKTNTHNPCAVFESFKQIALGTGGINVSFISGDKSALIVSLSSTNEAAGSRRTQVELSALSEHPDNNKTQLIM